MVKYETAWESKDPRRNSTYASTRDKESCQEQEEVCSDRRAIVHGSIVSSIIIHPSSVLHSTFYPDHERPNSRRRRYVRVSSIPALHITSAPTRPPGVHPQRASATPPTTSRPKPELAYRPAAPFPHWVGGVYPVGDGLEGVVLLPPWPG